MKKLLSFLTVILLTACGGGGGGGADQTPIAPPPPPLTIDFADSSHSTDEDVQLSTGLSITTNRSANLSYSLTNEPDYGSVSFSGTNFTYTPDANYYGSDEFEVTASAEGVSASAKVSLTINSVNDSPVLEASLIDPSDSEYPFYQSTGKVLINFNYSDVETSKADLSLVVSSNYGEVALSDVGDTTANLDFSSSNFSGPKDIIFQVSDGEISVSTTLKLWSAETKENSGQDNIYTLWGNTNDSTRGFRYAIVLDAMPDADVLEAGRSALRFFFKDFVHNDNSALKKSVFDAFNVVVIESPLGDSTVGIVTGNENNFEGCPGENSDPDIYCIADLAPLIRQYAESNFSDGYFDNYSVITGVDGRGVNRGNVNIQPLLFVSDINAAGTQYQRGPNALLSTLKHEFGHGFLFAGDGYTTDFTAVNDDGDPLYDLSGRYRWAENYIDTSYVQEPLETQWVHQYKSTTNIAGRDDQSDTSNAAIGYWAGCYSHDTYCHRASYSSIMNGMFQTSDERFAWRTERQRIKQTEFDPVAEEAFEIRALREQGLHDLSVSIGSSSFTATTNFEFDEANYELRWYVDGVEVTSAKNLKTLTVDKSSSNYQGVAFRIFDIRENPIIKATDDIDTFRDVYNGVFGPYGNWSCDLLPNTWTEVPSRICRSTARGEWANGTVYSYASLAKNNQEMKDYGSFKYWFEKSGLGSQFVINWSYY